MQNFPRWKIKNGNMFPKRREMAGINPPDIPGTSQMYSFGVSLTLETANQLVVISVRALTEAKAHQMVLNIIDGVFEKWQVTLFTDMQQWMQLVDNVDRGRKSI